MFCTLGFINKSAAFNGKIVSVLAVMMTLLSYFKKKCINQLKILFFDYKMIAIIVANNPPTIETCLAVMPCT